MLVADVSLLLARVVLPCRLMRSLLRLAGWSSLIVILFLVGILTLFSWQADRREQSSRQEAAPQSGRFVQSSDVELFVQEAGPADGPAVIFVHGTGAWSEMWREPMTALAAAGYHAIAVDVPPFGFSEKPSQARYSTEDQARRIVSLVRTLELPHLTLVGHSFGCRATVDAALHLKDQIDSLVLVDAAVNPTMGTAPPEPPSITGRITVAVFEIPFVRRALVAATVTNPLLTRRLFQTLIEDPDDATDSLVSMLQRPLVVRESTPKLSEWMQEFLFGDDAGALSSRAAAYRTFTPPTLLLWGERDQLTPLSKAEQLKNLLPDASIEVLKGLGHIPQVEDTAQFTGALLRFLTAQVPVQKTP